MRINKKDRFLSKLLPVNKNGCIEWRGSKWRMHRYSYALHYGEFDKKLHVLHKCDNPKCVTPSHLFLGTRSDNMRDMYQKNKRKYIIYNSKLSIFDILIIKELFKQGFSNVFLGKIYGVHASSIASIRNGKRWEHINNTSARPRC